jgi:hypothetical protein
VMGFNVPRKSRGITAFEIAYPQRNDGWTATPDGF